ncbi:choice-of-anchor I family protein [Demequina capsici]|uniref:Choice-of-anchor I family protein n=1 Tax=Demequina capsici TaxID=3075620 RepID=A0AA96F4A4_9MICO|nr:choice-of-anchor I family protein [Demequina sp. OYTSA14]WNM23662.1 choice-of-anchor I family protein [Demequina sp. OYTSA14]
MSLLPHSRPQARRLAVVAALVATCAAVAAPAQAAIVDDPITWSADDASLAMQPIGSFDTGVFDASAQEIVEYHAATQRLFTVDALTGRIRVLDASDPTHPTELFDLVTAGATASDGATIPSTAQANSVAVREDGLVVVAVENDPKTDAGWLVFFDAAGDGTSLGAVRVGAQPDMVAITPDGSKAVTADEGEPDDATYTIDPEGTITVVALPSDIAASAQADVRTADFHAYEGDSLPEGVRVFGKEVDTVHPVSANLEPEYVTVDQQSRKAYVTLQENNAIAVVDLRSATVTDMWSLGAKDWSAVGLDASDKDGAINIATYPIKGLYMPDTIASYQVRGTTYLVTANEGDAREWGDYEEPVRIKDLGKDGVAPLCDGVLTAAQRSNDELGRLDVSRASGLNADGTCYEELYAFGGRSFSIWTTDGVQVFDSGDDFEQITALAEPDYFNSDNAASDLESRSDAKGPEPEGVTIGKVSGRTYAFIGLERVGGVMVYDITSPTAPTFVTYVNNRDFSVSAEDAIGDGGDEATVLAAAGDLGPEGLTFIPADGSPSGEPLLAVANEVSGTTTLYSLSALGKPKKH